MASPYALDFSPVANALQLGVKNRLAEREMGLAEERQGFARELHPLQVQAQKQSIAHTGVMNPLEQKGKELEIAQAREAAQQRKYQRMRSFLDAHGDSYEKLPPDRQAKAWTDMQNSGYFDDEDRKIFADPVHGALWKDPVMGFRMLRALSEKYRDPLDKEALIAKTDEDKASAALKTAQAGALPNEQFKPLPENTLGVFSGRTGEIRPVAPGTDQAQRRFDKKYAEEQAPKLHGEAASKYADAENAYQNYGTLLALAPYAKTGFTGPIPPDMMLAMRKMAASVGLANAESIAPTELYKFMAQKGVFDLTKSLKPASNLDMVASERATASMQTDPSTLPVALPVLMKISQRSMLAHQLEMESYRRGVPPDPQAIFAAVNQKIPLLDMSRVAGAQNGPAPGAAPGTGTAPKQNTGQLGVIPQTGAAPAGAAPGSPPEAAILMLRRAAGTPDLPKHIKFFNHTFNGDRPGLAESILQSDEAIGYGQRPQTTDPRLPHNLLRRFFGYEPS
jgi:hypothetical protein